MNRERVLLCSKIKRLIDKYREQRGEAYSWGSDVGVTEGNILGKVIKDLERILIEEK